MRLSREGSRWGPAVPTGSIPIIAILLFHHALAASTASAAVAALGRRDKNEHVTLSDCRDGQGVVSSQMAYFPGNPGATPQDVAVVSTPSGQAALWAGQTTEGLFTDTGTKFTAKLGPVVSEGSYAGTGSNGYGPFTCWQRYQLNLYKYGNTTCSQVYDCTHEAAPTTTSTPSSTPSPSSPSNSTSGTSTGQSSGLSSGALAAIIGGVVGAVAITLAVLGFLWVYWRRWPGGKFNPFRRTKPAELNGAGVSRGEWGALASKDSMKKYHDPRGPGVVGGEPMYELDGQWRAEVQGQDVAVRGELDGMERVEMDSYETKMQRASVYMPIQRP